MNEYRCVLLSDFAILLYCVALFRIESKIPIISELSTGFMYLTTVKTCLKNAVFVFLHSFSSTIKRINLMYMSITFLRCIVLPETNGRIIAGDSGT